MVKDLDTKGKHTVGDQVEQDTAEDGNHDSSTNLV